MSALKAKQSERPISSLVPVRRLVTIRGRRLEDKEAIWRVHSSATKNTCNSNYLEEQIQGWTDLLEPEHYQEAIQKLLDSPSSTNKMVK
ncbi:MAG: hypothetical protein L0338_07000 [Acidobacteria bacterium]|nr:hypothetical protein [Acidobacteriota bacterium]